ncbi:MAG: response regulator [Candidatus Dadabacteria bacterium]|nr:response regulator [Candidatus Dadabacteria bacterium]NIS07819.1 response regulator [Candidatus Dadabacteria bacterium]NIV42771.1 response regulator [Candidatus Dadabacteria bacterium]NIX14838.1 response regulator [Candidatus Dadabacteria bacterium]NIY21438.1 response regulator [Candidatus Dadabacteria bacterium]
MQKTRVMVVEDESIVAKNIQTRLKQLGYVVPLTVSSGEEALEKIESIEPNIVLMDVVLDGKMDGIETAEIIYSKYKTPVVYLTAYADDETLERAKRSTPFGYIVKPFEVKELKSVIEIALSSYNTHSELKETSERLQSSFDTLQSCILVIDNKGAITFANKQSELALGLEKEMLLGSLLDNIIKLSFENSLEEVFSKNNHLHTELLTINMPNLPICIDCSPISNDKGTFLGSLIKFQIASESGEVSCTKNNQTASLSSSGAVISVGIVASPRLVLEGIKNIVEKQQDFNIVFEETEASNIIEHIKQHEPDIICIDNNVPELDLNTVLDFIESSDYSSKVILLLNKFKNAFLISILTSGVRGCLTSTSESTQLVEAIRTVHNGNIWLEIDTLNQILPKMVTQQKKKKHSLGSHNLTKREEEIARLILKGNSNKKIANKLYITEKTVKTHLTKIFKKLGITNRLELAVKFNAGAQ